MYNATMDMKYKDAMKAHGILKLLQHTQNTVISINHTSHLPYHLKIVELLHTARTSKRQIQLVPHSRCFILKTM